MAPVLIDIRITFSISSSLPPTRVATQLTPLAQVYLTIAIMFLRDSTRRSFKTLGWHQEHEVHILQRETAIHGPPTSTQTMTVLEAWPPMNLTKWCATKRNLKKIEKQQTQHRSYRTHAKIVKITFKHHANRPDQVQWHEGKNLMLSTTNLRPEP